MKAQSKVYAIITQTILDSLALGSIPWRKPWVSQVPTSLNTSKWYRGVNHLLLSNISDSPSQLFVTFAQAKALGKSIKKGSKSLPVVYHVFKEDEETGTSEYKGARFYRVFPVEATDLTPNDIESVVNDEVLERLKHKPLSGECDTGIESFLATVLTRTSLKYSTSNKAYYMPSTHTLAMPSVELFNSYDEYYATYFHELIHSTMAELKRDASGYKFGSHKYSFEELVAEIGAQFLCDIFQIRNTTVENSHAYIKSWVKKFDDDKGMIIKASSQAQKAVDYLLALTQAPF